MVTVTSLWLAILLSAVLVFMVSSIIHMVLKYHNKDMGQVPSEDAVMDALRAFDIPPGDYVIPCAGSVEGMKSPDFQAKVEKGPIAFVTFLPAGSWGMGKSLVLWFVYAAVIALFAGYIATRTLSYGAEYLTVMQVVGTTAFMAYAMGLWQNSIWWKRSWSTTLRSTFDGLVYGLVTGGTFGWLWPG